MRDKHAASISLRSATYDEDGLTSDVALQVPGPSAGGTIPLAQHRISTTHVQAAVRTTPASPFLLPCLVPV
jgi:hypothetical protein